MARKKKEPAVSEEDLLPTETPYHDQEDEWADMRTIERSSETKDVYESFTGGNEKGIAGKTDLTSKQAVALTHLRVMQASYERRGMKWMAVEVGTMLEWFETYRLSVNRKSRVEAVDMLRGRMQLGQPGAPGNVNTSDPTRFS